MKGTFQTICSFALLITLGVLVLICAALPPVGNGKGDRPPFAPQAGNQTELQVWLALKVFGNGAPPAPQGRRAQKASDPDSSS